MRLAQRVRPVRLPPTRALSSPPSSHKVVPRRTEAVWLRARLFVDRALRTELATQAHPSQPHSRLMVPVHVGGLLADSG